MHEITSRLREAALAVPEATEGVACEGTPLEKHTVKVRNKAFLFLGRADAMLKLVESLDEAVRLAAEDPDHYKVGAHGWVTIRFDVDGDPPLERLLRWIDESRRAIGPKRRGGSRPLP